MSECDAGLVGIGGDSHHPIPGMVVVGTHSLPIGKSVPPAPAPPDSPAAEECVATPTSDTAVCLCGSNEYLHVPIHVDPDARAQSIRRDCAACGRFLYFPVRYGRDTNAQPKALRSWPLHFRLNSPFDSPAALDWGDASDFVADVLDEWPNPCPACGSLEANGARRVAMPALQSTGRIPPTTARGGTFQTMRLGVDWNSPCHGVPLHRCN